METRTEFDLAIDLEVVCHQAIGLGRPETETLQAGKPGAGCSVRTNPVREIWSGRATDWSDQCGGLVEHDEEM